MKNLVLSTRNIDDFISDVANEVVRRIEFGNSQLTLDQSKIDDILTIDQAASFLKLSKPTLYRLVSERKIPHSKKGKRLYFSKVKLTEWVESGEVRTQAQIKKEVNK